MGDGGAGGVRRGREKKKERKKQMFRETLAESGGCARGDAPIHYGVALLATHLPLPLQ